MSKIGLMCTCMYMYVHGCICIGAVLELVMHMMYILTTYMYMCVYVLVVCIRSVERFNICTVCRITCHSTCTHTLSLSLKKFFLRLRLRVKAMQEVVDSQSDRLAQLLASEHASLLNLSCHSDESTGQGNIHHTMYVRTSHALLLPVVNDCEESSQQLSKVIQEYMKQIEELK